MQRTTMTAGVLLVLTFVGGVVWRATTNPERRLLPPIPSIEKAEAALATVAVTCNVSRGFAAAFAAAQGDQYPKKQQSATQRVALGSSHEHLGLASHCASRPSSCLTLSISPSAAASDSLPQLLLAHERHIQVQCGSLSESVCAKTLAPALHAALAPPTPLDTSAAVSSELQSSVSIVLTTIVPSLLSAEQDLIKALQEQVAEMAQSAEELLAPLTNTTSTTIVTQIVPASQLYSTQSASVQDLVRALPLAAIEKGQAFVQVQEDRQPWRRFLLESAASADQKKPVHVVVAPRSRKLHEHARVAVIPAWGTMLLVAHNETKSAWGPSLKRALRLAIGLPDFPVLKQQIQQLAQPMHVVFPKASVLSLAPSWEIDRVRRTLAKDNLRRAVKSLSVVAHLQDAIDTLPTSRTTQEHFMAAVLSIEAAADAAEGGFLEDAARLSAAACRFAEAAAFDPAALEVLYFPSELRYAIYLPILVPIFVTIFKLLKDGRTEQKALHPTDFKEQ